MTEQEARELKEGDKIRLLPGKTSVWDFDHWIDIPYEGGEIRTVDRVQSEPFEHTHIWFKETERYSLPSQCERYVEKQQT